MSRATSSSTLAGPNRSRWANRGLRSGEKLHEKLLIDRENFETTSNPKIWLVKPGPRPKEVFHGLLAEAKRACAKNDDDRAVGLIASMVPEFQPELRVEFQPEYAKTISRVFRFQLAIEKNGREGYRSCVESRPEVASPEVASPEVDVVTDTAEEGLAMARDRLTRRFQESIAVCLGELGGRLALRGDEEKRSLILPVEFGKE